MNDHKIKQCPEDFYVSEVLTLTSASSSTTIHAYFLEKSGYRTLEAIALLEKHFNIASPQKIGFAGLKDEDGITLQYITFPKFLTNENIDFFHKKFNTDKNKYIKITPHLPMDNHIEIGALHGNCFRVKIRNLSKDSVQLIGKKREHFLHFINYYGPQRFGLPGQIKNTALIGKALLEKKLHQAIDELCKQSSPEAEKAKEYFGNPTKYFEELDDRLIAFYQSSYFSSLWNQTIAKTIIRSQMSHEECMIEDIPYLLLTKQDDFGHILANLFHLKNKRATVTGDRVGYYEYERPVITQTKLIIDNIGQDEMNIDKMYCTASFFLPSGSYASMVIPQFLAFFNKENHAMKIVEESC